MARKTIQTRVQHKRETAANWDSATGFIPLDGELIVYKPDAASEPAKLKVGDGKTTVGNLPFTVNNQDLTTHTGNTTVHITAEERNDWDAAKAHSAAAHAPSNAEKNQNAFSNIKVGSTTVAADTTTDTVEFAAGSNITLTPDATNDKITIAASHPSVSKSTDTTSTITPEHGLTFTAVDTITRDTYGHVTKINTKTVTLPDAGLHYVDSSGMAVVDGSSTSSAYLAAKWSISNVDGITVPTDGMSISLRTPAAGYNGGILLSIDNGVNYYPIVRNVNSLVTTHYAQGSTIILTFNPTQTAAPYTSAGTTSTVTGCWQIADYDKDTTYTNVKLGHGYTTCSTAASTKAKTASLSSYTLTTGGIVAVKFTNGITVASPTLNINSKGAKAIYYKGAALTDTSLIKAGDTVTFIYSSNYHIISIDRLDAEANVQSDWNVTDTTSDAYIKNKPTLATVATSGSYTDLTNTPTIPTVNNATLTIQKNGTSVATFTANSSTNATANITVPTGAAADKGVDTSISASSTSTNLPTSKAVAAFVEGKGYKTTDNNTTYTIATGDSNGQIKVTPSSGSAYNVSVKGLGSAAYATKGTANGVAELDANGKVPTSQLPSFVDDVLEYSAKSSFPTTGETGKIYVDTATNKTYRWSGSAYVEISASLALGETSSTAYRGDRGKTAYDHSQATHARTDATATAASTTNGNIKINGTETTVYTLPTASSTLGGVKTTSTVTSTSGLTACPIISGVPYYKNTTYSNASLGQGYGTCDTAAATAAKVVTLSSYSLTTGGVVSVKFTYAVPANATLNINSKGAKAIRYKGAAITEGIIGAGEVATFVYDGSYYHLIAVDRNRFFTSLVPVGVSVPASVDLNTTTYLKVGNYYCSKSADAKTLTNCPTQNAFMMTVSSPLSTTVDNETGTWVYRLRTLQDYTGPMYIQCCSTDGTAGNWSYGDWQKVIQGSYTTTTNAITRYSNARGDLKNSKITIEDVTNSRDSSKTANVLVIPAEGGKKMVYGYCTDQVDGTSFIGGVFDESATSYPYAEGLAIGGTSGNLLWKGSKVLTAADGWSGGNISSHIYLTGSKVSSSTGNTTQLVFGTPDENHIAISSNSKALVLNPTTTATTNQIVLYLDQPSKFPGGIQANLTGTASNASKVTNAVTFNAGGSGAASGTTFNGSTARTISYNTIGAVPTSRKINGKALSSDITISADDLGVAPAYTYGTTDLVAGTSDLESGKLYFVYE